MVSSSLRKCPVILLRIVFILLLLEGGLWVSGLAHIAIYSRNQKEIQKENFVILTIGDSMTLSGEDPWPWQLQRMLNEKYPSLNVMVVSQATAGSNTKEIADKLNSFDWEKYQPKVIVAMMGVSDKGELGKKSWFFSLLDRSKTIAILREKIHNSSNASRDKLYLGQTYYNERRFHEAEPIHEELLEIFPGNVPISLNLGVIYLELKKPHKAVPLFRRYVKANPWDREAFFYLMRASDQANLSTEALSLAEVVVRKEPNNEEGWSVIVWNLIKTGQGEAVESLLLQLQAKQPDIASYVFRDIGRRFYSEGKFNESDNYFEREFSLKKSFYNALTKESYERVYSLSQEHDALLIAMQYPLLPISVMKLYFENDERILFVENDQNFRNALGNSTYDDLFVDNFFGVFGHCTKRGNELIAMNVEQAISKYFSLDKEKSPTNPSDKGQLRELP